MKTYGVFHHHHKSSVSMWETKTNYNTHLT